MNILRDAVTPGHPATDAAACVLTTHGETSLGAALGRSQAAAPLAHVHQQHPALRRAGGVAPGGVSPAQPAGPPGGPVRSAPRYSASGALTAPREDHEQC